MKKVILLALMLILCIPSAKGQTDSTVDLYVVHDSFLVGVQQDSPYVVPVFTDTNINNILNKYTFTVFRKAVPMSRFADMRQLYRVECNNTHVAEELVTGFPDIFPHYDVTPHMQIMGRYTPNDWTPNSYRNPWALDYIRAREAWGLEDLLIDNIPNSKGAPSVVIGISDTYFELFHPDLFHKIVWQDATAMSWPSIAHGSVVAGMAAAHTDNGAGYPGVGFKCSLRTTTDMNEDGLHLMSSYDPSTPLIPRARVEMRAGAFRNQFIQEEV